MSARYPIFAGDTIFPGLARACAVHKQLRLKAKRLKYIKVKPPKPSGQVTPRAVKTAGGIRALARQLGLAPSTVTRALRRLDKL